ncbi:hypothetical protein KB206_01580 [Microvirga sp. STS02]|uniref:hypothetical protein n=1 Tax=Hymenobacter negativus TaxID=2795026 RepID=UPI0018DBB98E|nr:MULTISPECIES: hypothetical protein [Bacteria]MBH8567557.1 hypothetical protein [Hymenobacter negativus]MBR7207289.1 hypothetical protein [Microvirga sp. STS02]
MSTSPEFDALVKRVLKRTDNKATKPELEALFYLGDEAYERHSPHSVGKHLTILSIAFAGMKKDGQEVNYTCKPKEGVNLWVGDNLVGKSSIFKVVKFALTGKNSLDREISGWLREIWVEFTLGELVYTSHIYKGLDDKDFVFEFYNASRDALGLTDEEETLALRTYEGSMVGYTNFLEKFFFREFDYYNMQWTAKHSGKAETGLVTANASWKTYFKSVYLEAEDYKTLMFGAQSELVLQMLLGLELTYPINRLKVKKELLQSQLGALKATVTPAAAPPEEIAKLDKSLAEVESKIEELRQARKVALTPISKEADRELQIARNKYQTGVENLSRYNAELLALTNSETELGDKIAECIRQSRSYEGEIIRKKKRANELRDYESFGAFFNALQVKTCPSCSHEVEKVMVEQEKDTGNCRLCSHQVELHEVEPGTYEVEIESLLNQAAALKKDQYDFDVRRADAEAKLKQVKIDVSAKKQAIAYLSLTRLAAEIDTLQQAMLAKPVAFDYEKHDDATAILAVKKDALIRERNALVLPSAAKPDGEAELLAQQIEWLNIAQEELGKLRDEKSKALLQKFEDLYLQQLHGFGLDNYEQVTVDDKFKFIYVKADEEYSFDELTAGEQLRAKLGLYIALIQMDVQYRFGRHPRFIILDSPAKEEGDPTFVEALKQTLSYIEREMGQDLQVFVGTAVRPLASAVDASKVDTRNPADASGKKQYFF